jgi:hypothetical protein
MKKLLLAIALLFSANFAFAQSEPITGPVEPYHPTAPCWNCEVDLQMPINFWDSSLYNALYNQTSGDGYRNVALYDVASSVYRNVSFYRVSGHNPMGGGIHNISAATRIWYASVGCFLSVTCTLADSPGGDPNMTWQ